MHAQHAVRPRVLLGDLEPMVRLGMSRVLSDSGVEVLAEEERPGAVVEEARRLSPDAVVLALDGSAARALGEQVRAAAPRAKVILWARDETEMQVFDPGSSAPRLIYTAVSDALLSELSARQARERE